MEGKDIKNERFLREVGIIALQLIKFIQDVDISYYQIDQYNSLSRHPIYQICLKNAIQDLQYRMDLSLSDRLRNRLAQEAMQHPDYNPEIDWDEYDNPEEESNSEFGKTYAWFLTETYGGPNGFANKPSYGQCFICATPLPVWRRCVSCARFYFDYLGKEIYITCMECTDQDHQRDLENIDTCENCWGPPSLQIEFKKIVT